MDEAALVQYCKDNNAQAQKMLFTTYVGRMMILCLRYISNQEDAREVMMDGFIVCFKNIGGFTYMGTGSLQAWLSKIMVNQCLMRLRKRQMSFLTHDESIEAEMQDGRADVIDNLNAKEIIKMIHEMPDGCKTIFNLYVFEKLSHRAIAALLDISESTSKSQLHRARTLLKEKILQTS